MGIKKSARIGRLIGMAAMMAAMSEPDMYEITERNTTPKRKPKPVKQPKPFSKQEGVLRMIEDYNLIKEGKSKKGIIKQARIKVKVDKWLSDGWLKEEDLTAN